MRCEPIKSHPLYPGGLIILAVLFWFIIFTPRASHQINFWVALTLSTLTLSALAWWADGEALGKLIAPSARLIGIGLASVPLLYGLFYLGKALVSEVMGTSGVVMVEMVYASKTQAPLWVIALLLLVIIGPCEEIFWRGFLQRRISLRWGRLWGLGGATLVYTLVHAWSGNPVLILAAGVAGLFWGILYLLTDSVIPSLISHALWDFTVFILFPLA